MAILRLLAAAALVASTAAAHAADWTPPAWSGENTLQVRTTAPGEGEHWSTLWLVVLDGQLYVRLGTRAADRIVKNTTAPLVGVRVGGQQFDGVNGVPAPEAVDRVAKAMADKYWSDVLIRHMSHPMTLRLEPAPRAEGTR